MDVKRHGDLVTLSLDTPSSPFVVLPGAEAAHMKGKELCDAVGRARDHVATLVYFGQSLRWAQAPVEQGSAPVVGHLDARGMIVTCGTEKAGPYSLDLAEGIANSLLNI